MWILYDEGEVSTGRCTKWYGTDSKFWGKHTKIYGKYNKWTKLCIDVSHHMVNVRPNMVIDKVCEHKMAECMKLKYYTYFMHSYYTWH